MWTTRELIERCRRSEPEAIEVLVARFRPGALSLARALLGEGEAEDAVQEAFVTALGRLDDLREPAAFPGWWRQIVRRACARIRRRRRPEVALTDEHHERAADIATPEAALAREQLRAEVRGAVSALPGVGQRTAELFYLEELSQADIAHALGVPRGTVKRRLHDARGRLRNMLLGAIDPSGEGRTTRLPTEDDA